MATQHDCTLSTALLEQIASQGLDALPELMRTIINAALEAERQQPPTQQRIRWMR